MPKFVTPVEEPELQKIINTDKPKKERKKKTAAPKKTESLLSEEQQIELKAKQEKLKELRARVEPLLSLIDNAKNIIAASKVKDYVMDISKNPSLMRAARKVFKKKKTSISYSDYLSVLEKLKEEQLKQIEELDRTAI